MDNINFEWDENKNQINKKKHGISFSEALTVFYDNNAVLFDDPEHSINEDRFLIIGLTENDNVCIVSHCYRSNDNIIRIISARKATKSEKQVYYGFWKGGDSYEGRI
ncbi:MAG: BrnT family toxin [Lachnospiraceae bacterium]|nr:BrnT family toxin [Lachnospiraceae bacterium]